MTPSGAEASLPPVLWSSCFQWEVRVEIIRGSWSGACVRLIYQTYQRRVFMGFCSCSCGVKVNESPCWWKEVGCAGRNLYPDLSLSPIQLSTWLVMLGQESAFLELLQDLFNVPWAKHGSESKAGLCLKSQESKERQKDIHWHLLQTSSKNPWTECLSCEACLCFLVLSCPWSEQHWLLSLWQFLP